MKQNETRQTPFSIPRMAAAFCILATPMINLVDVVPDFIAYLLLFTTLSEATMLSPAFEDSVRGFRRLFWLTLSKLPALFIMLSISGSSPSERPIIAVFSLVYAILELMLILPTFTRFYEALTYLHVAKEDPETIHISHDFTRLQGFTVFFFILRSACSCLPEFLLALQDDSELTAYRISSFYPYLAAAGAGVTLIFSVIFCIRVCHMFSRLADDHRLLAQTASVLDDRRIALRRNREPSHTLLLSVLLLTVATGMQIDPTFDGINYLPNFLSALVFAIAAALLFGIERRPALPCAVCAVLYGISSFVTLRLTDRFLDSYSLRDITYIPAASQAYGGVIAAAVIECILFFALLVSLILLFVALIRRHAERGFEPLPTRTALYAVAGGCSGVLRLVGVILSRFTQVVEADSEYISSGRVTLPRYEWTGMVLFAVNIVWLLTALFLYSGFNQSIRAHYDYHPEEE